MKQKMIIVDGNSLLFRAFYATFNPYTPIMRTKDGVPTNAIFAFSNMINKIVNEFKNDEHILVAFDTGKKTFRHAELATYKANRKPLPEDLITQMPIAREYLKAMGIYTSEWEGYEGDDIAGSAAKKAASEGYEVTLYTSDRDFLQLIDASITVHILRKGMSDICVMNQESLWDMYGLRPEQIPDYKGLMGDSSDNLKGIPGVGDKTAVKLIKEYGTLENIISASASLKGKIYESIIANQDQGKLCKHLAEIKTDLNLPFTIEDTRYIGYDFQKLSSFCSRYELKHLLSRLNYRRASQKIESEEVHFSQVSKFPLVGEPKCVSIALLMGDDYNTSPVYGMAYTVEKETYFESMSDIKNDEGLLALLKNPQVSKYAYDFKAIKVALHRYDIDMDGLTFDLLIAAYLLDSSLSNDSKDIFHFFGKELINKNQDSLSLLDDQSDITTPCLISHYVHSLYEQAMQSLKKAEALMLFNDIEIPLVSILADMEIEGFPLNQDVLLNMGEGFKIKLNVIAHEIYALAGQEFNISSPKQIAEVLFEKLGIPSPTKKQSTSVEVLKKLQNRYPIVSKILEYRKYAKLISTYVDGLIAHIYPDGRLHPEYNQAQTTTGRLSSSNPNIQNISIRDEEGREIRKAFYYDDDNLEILSYDYSQVELRILASLSHCQKLIDAFNNQEDIHAMTAKYIFQKQEITSDERRKAKTVNFGIVYGISEWGLAEQLDIPAMEARQIIKSFYDTYPEILAFMSQVASDAEKNGYAKTLLGRIRYIREFHDSNYQIREFARRAATNAPIQGTAADIIKIAMVKIAHLLKEQGFRTQMVCQIHDELIFKVPKEELQSVSILIAETMENAYPLKCKLAVDGSHGRTWFDAK